MRPFEEIGTNYVHEFVFTEKSHNLMTHEMKMQVCDCIFGGCLGTALNRFMPRPKPLTLDTYVAIDDSFIKI